MSVIILSAPSCGMDAGDVQALMADVRFRFWDAARSYDYYIRTCSYDLVGEWLLCKACGNGPLGWQDHDGCHVPWGERARGTARMRLRQAPASAAAASGAP